MFREMRRKDKSLSKEDTISIMNNVSFGTLAIDSIEGYPYSVPVSYVYDDGKIYFHSANAGLKYESIKANDKVSISMVEKDDVQPSAFTTLYRSVIAYGTISDVTEKDESKKALKLIVDKYSKGYEKEGEDYTEKHKGQFSVYRIDIEHLTGKGKG